jgi:hypothetical protein
MTVDKPTAFVVEYESAAEHSRLEALAKERGTYTEDCDDWFDPAQIAVTVDGGETLTEARKVARKLLRDGAAVYDVRIARRLGIERRGQFWDYEGTEEVESFS